MIVGLIILFVLCIILTVEAYKLIVKCRDLEFKIKCIRNENKAKIKRESTKASGEQLNKIEEKDSTSNNISSLGVGFPPPIVSLPKNFTFQKKVDKRIKKQHNKKVK